MLTESFADKKLNFRFTMKIVFVDIFAVVRVERQEISSVAIFSE